MRSTTITIGRNKNDSFGLLTDSERPMGAQVWEEFKSQARNALRRAVIDSGMIFTDFWYEDHSGIGIWGDVPEESYKVTALTIKNISPLALKNLKTELGELCRLFYQDAIALTLGESELISG